MTFLSKIMNFFLALTNFEKQLNITDSFTPQSNIRK